MKFYSDVLRVLREEALRCGSRTRWTRSRVVGFETLTTLSFWIDVTHQGRANSLRNIREAGISNNWC